jgi:hypothetical protein
MASPSQEAPQLGQVLGQVVMSEEYAPGRGSFRAHPRNSKHGKFIEIFCLFVGNNKTSFEDVGATLDTPIVESAQGKPQPNPQEG